MDIKQKIAKIKAEAGLITELFDPQKHVTPAIREKRLAICLACPKARYHGFQCGVCKCIISQATKLKNKYCEDSPSRWGKEL